LAALTGGVLVLAIGVGIAVSSGHLFSSNSSTPAGQNSEPAPSVVVPTTTPKPNVTPAPVLRSFTDGLGNGVRLEMISLPGGTFEMGSPNGQGVDHEYPKHSVRVSPFAIGKYEVTQAQWQAVMGNNPSHFKGKTLPVEQVSWDDVVKFCQKLHEKTGKNYRLPTEAEWEYAARSGSTGRWSFGNDRSLVEEYGWHSSNSNDRTHPVGQKKPNAFGLYDTEGNVFEWVQDWYNDDYYKQKVFDNPQGPSSGEGKVFRGSSYSHMGPCISPCYIAVRGACPPTGCRYSYFGFRVVADALTQ
jgi:formylglycine-generating enzyme required for sulfatase activity